MHKWYRTIIGFVAGISAVPALGADAKTGQLEEIVVTATRHEESLSKVPISVTAMTQESLDVKGIKDFQDVARFTPGVSVDNSGTNAISIRGISSSGGAGTTGIYIDDTPAQTVLDIRAKARRLKHDPSANLGLIILDYLQLMRGTGEDSREQEISSISRSLKALAKELQVPVIALSQLNRQVEQRQDKRPGMADLRESGALEQDADVIVFLYRDEQYNPETAEPGVAEHRFGMGIILGEATRRALTAPGARSEERRVGKECRSRWSPYH